MDDAFFISRDAQHTANDLNHGDAAGAANRLRDDCAHMTPTEFSSLLRQTKADEMYAPPADINLYRNGQVMVRSQDGTLTAAGQLPPQEMARLLPPLPPPCPIINENRPPEIIIGPGPRVYGTPEPHRMYVPPGGAYYRAVPLNNTVVDTVGGAATGAIIDRKNPGVGAVVGGIIGLGVGTALDNTNNR